MLRGRPKDVEVPQLLRNRGFLIRWGSLRGDDFIHTLNKKRNIAIGSNKPLATRMLQSMNNDIPFEPTLFPPTVYPAIVRETSKHYHSLGLWKVWSERDVNNLVRKAYWKPFYKGKEHRIYFCGGRVFCYRKKKFRNDENERCAEYMPNTLIPANAVLDIFARVNTLFHYDFGALDVIWTPEGEPRVLEINSAPALYIDSISDVRQEFIDYWTNFATAHTRL